MAAPVNTSLPLIGGTPARGQTLNTTNGLWTGAVSYAYQWFWIIDGVPFTIAGQTANTHLLGDDDVGLEVGCRVTATGDGSTAADSLPVGPVTSPPVCTYQPEALAFDGQSLGDTLFGSSGNWIGYPPLDFPPGYQWQANGANIPAATANSYEIVESPGTALRMVVTQTNSEGSDDATSNEIIVAAGGGSGGDLLLMRAG